MNKELLEQLFSTAERLGYCLKLRFHNNHSIILNPVMGRIKIVELDGIEFLKLSRSFVRLEEIDTAYIYTTKDKQD